MSLEVAIQENTAALRELIAVTKEANEGRAQAIAAAASIQSGEGATRTRKKKDEPATGAATTTEAAKPAGPPSVDDLRKAFGDYMGIEDEAERNNRKTYVKKILELVGAGKATEIAEDKRAQAIAWVNSLAGGAVPAELADEAEEEDDMLG